MDEDRFYNDVAILAEAGRISPQFAAKVMGPALDDEAVDALVEEGRRIIEEQADLIL